MTKRLDDLCADIEQTNPAADCLGGWKTFFEADIDSDEPIPHLLHALDKAFGYRTYADGEMKQAEVLRSGNAKDRLGAGRGLLRA